MKYIILIFLFFLCTISFSQKRKQKKKYGDLLSFTPERAIKDTTNGFITIIFSGGKVPTIFTKNDSLFEVKYNVLFESLGCVWYQTDEELNEYCRIIFEYMDSHHGEKWRKEIRKDAIGL